MLTPLLVGDNRRLEPHQLQLLTFWALKTALMLDKCSEASMQNIPIAQYPELYAIQGVLSSTHVWLGACNAARGSWCQDGCEVADHVFLDAYLQRLGARGS